MGFVFKLKVTRFIIYLKHVTETKLKKAAFLFLALLLSGCATKNYGRQGEITEYEKQTMTCREVALEQAKVTGFLDHVEKESQFDGRSVLSFLGDFGIGNMMEKDNAIKSANARLKQLNELSLQKECGQSQPNAN